MLTPDKMDVIVPPVPSPRNNKKVIHGKFTINDLIIIIPNLIITLVIMFCSNIPVWANILQFLFFTALTFFLVFPLGFLGQDKIYVFIMRGIKFWLGEQKHFASEDLFSSDTTTHNEKKPSKTQGNSSQEQVDRVENKEIKKTTIKNKEENKKIVEQEEPQDFLSRLFSKKQKNKNK